MFMPPPSFDRGDFMSNRKVPCGGFGLDENFLGVNENGELSLVGGASEDKAYQQLVTDGTGKATWEDRLAYDDSKVVVGPLKDGTILVKVADEIPDFVSIGESVNVYSSFGDVQKCEIRDLDFEPDTGASVPYAAESSAVFVTEDNQKVYLNSDLLTFPKKGVYFLCLENVFYVSGVSSSTSETPEITWDGNIGSVKKIDEKLLPELTKLVMLSSTSGSAKKFEITVDDTGTLSATEITSGDEPK